MTSLYRNGVFVGTEDPKDELEKQCEVGNVEFVQDYVKSGQGVKDTSGHLLVLLSNKVSFAQSGKVVSIVKLLVDNGAKVDYCDKTLGRTCLHLATEKGHLNLVTYLLDNGAEVNLAARRGNTALHRAVKKPGKQEIVNVLLDRGAKNLRNKGGKTPAYLLCKSGDYSCAGRILSEKEVDLGRDIHGRSGLYFAALDNFRDVSTFVTVSQEQKYDIFKRAALLDDYVVFHAILQNISPLPSSLAIETMFAMCMQKGDYYCNEVPKESWIEENRSKRIMNKRAKLESWKVRLKDRQEIISQVILNAVSHDDYLILDNGCTILTHACMSGQVLLVTEILSQPGADKIMELGMVSPVWLAANEGHSRMLQITMNHCPKSQLQVMQKAPDGTTPVTIAILRGHASVLSVLQPYCDSKQFNILKRELSLTTSKESPITDDSLKVSPLVELSKTYPSFNENIEKVMDKALEKGKSKVLEVQEYAEEERTNPNKDPSRQAPLLTYASAVPNFADIMSAQFKKEKGRISLRDPEVPSENVNLEMDVEPNFLKPFCCLRKAGDLDAIEVSKIVAEAGKTCMTNCAQKEECSKILALLGACHLLQQKLSQKDRLGFLKPRCILIGSVAEGTRLDKANEIDVTVVFDALSEFPMSFKEPTYLLTIPEESPLAMFGKQERGKGPLIYDHSSFLKYFLDSIKACLGVAMLEPGWPKDLFTYVLTWKPCEQCHSVSREKRTSNYYPSIHCTNCLPAVTHTKAGPCIILQWKKGTPVTMDLIPVFPVQSQDDKGILSLFNGVTNYLLEKKPPQWAKHLRGIIERDRILPEALALEVTSPSKQKTFDVAIKLLNYHPEQNYVIRPGQGLSTRDLRTNGVLRDVYIHVKTLKTLWTVDVKSYVVKKVILSQSMKEQLLKKELHMQERLFAVLSHPELKRKFGENIIFSQWQQNIRTMQKSQIWDDNEIPSRYAKNPQIAQTSSDKTLHAFQKLDLAL